MRRGGSVLVPLPSDYGKPRPALVLQADVPTADDCGSVVVCPQTTHVIGASSVRVAVEPTEANGLYVRSEVMVEKAVGADKTQRHKAAGELINVRMTCKC